MWLNEEKFDQLRYCYKSRHQAKDLFRFGTARLRVVIARDRFEQACAAETAAYEAWAGR